MIEKADQDHDGLVS